MAYNLSQKYNATVIPINCLELNLDDINLIFSKLLYEFMIERIEIKFPRWIDGLDINNPLKMDLFESIKNTFSETLRLKDVNDSYTNLEECD